MKVITKSKCEDTIRLEDVDLDKHYVVGTGNSGRLEIIGKGLGFTVKALIIWDKDRIQFGSSYNSLAELLESNPSLEKNLHAFNTLHEMLDFVKANTEQ